MSNIHWLKNHKNVHVHVFKMSKSTTAKNISAFADLVKVSRKKISFDLWTTNTMKLPHKKFYLSKPNVNAPFMKFVGGYFFLVPPPTHFQMPNTCDFSLRTESLVPPPWCVLWMVPLKINDIVLCLFQWRKNRDGSRL